MSRERPSEFLPEREYSYPRFQSGARPSQRISKAHVIPAKAGITFSGGLDSRFRGNDENKLD
jgi:hypothetical protein